MEREEFLKPENLMRLRIKAEDAGPYGSVSIWGKHLLFLLDEIERLKESGR